MSKKKEKDNVNLVTTGLIWLAYILWVLVFASLELSVVCVLMHLVFLGIIVFLNFNDLKEQFLKLKKDKKVKRTLLLYIGILFVILMISNMMISGLLQVFDSDFVADSSSSVIYDIFKKGPFGILFVTFLTSIFYPIVEENVFRKSLRPILNNNIVFVVVTSVLTWYFQVTLISPSITEFIVALSVLFNSIFAAIVYVKKKNIWYAILPRMGYNLIVCVIQLFSLM